MAIIHQLRRLASVVLIGGGMAFAAVSTPIAVGAITPAAAQISEDAQVALEQYGSWRPHPRFGEVWVPAGVPPEWRPYAYGHWVYTDEWGWYWVSDDVEADWGWVVYHYGRWAFERGFGWYWVPGDEWAPAWVDWRYGDDYSGWAPLPPDELIGTYEVEPTYWVFVPTRYMAAPRLRTYFVPCSTSFSDLALHAHRQSHLCGAWLAARCQSGHLTGFRCPRERRAGVDLPGAPARICLDARCRGCGASSPRRFTRRARRSSGWPRSRWAGCAIAPGHRVCGADDGGDSAKRCGHCAAATRKKRAWPIGNASTARRARRRPDAVGCACARANATAASTAAAKVRRANTAASTGPWFALGAAANPRQHHFACDNAIRNSARGECTSRAAGAARGTSRPASTRWRGRWSAAGGTIGSAVAAEYRAADSAAGATASAAASAARTASATTAAVTSATTAAGAAATAACCASAAASTAGRARACTTTTGCTRARTAASGSAAEEAASEAG